MGLTPDLTVLFDVPPEIAVRLGNGQYSRWGGCIRDVATGRWTHMLRETRPLQELLSRNPADLPPLVARQLGMLGVQLNHVFGLQLLNFGVTVAGFAMVLHRINELDRKLDRVMSDLQVIKGQIDWMDRRADLELTAQLIANLRAADWAEKTGRFGELVPVRRALDLSETRHRLLLTEMAQRGVAYLLHDVYTAHIYHLTLAGLARTRCDWKLDGPEAGFTSIQEVANTLISLREDFIRPLGSFRQNIEALLPLGENAFQKVSSAVNSLSEAEDLVKGYREELDYCRRIGASVDDWNSLTESVTTPQVVVLTANPSRG